MVQDPGDHGLPGSAPSPTIRLPFPRPGGSTSGDEYTPPRRTCGPPWRRPGGALFPPVSSVLAGTDLRSLGGNALVTGVRRQYALADPGAVHDVLGRLEQRRVMDLPGDPRAPLERVGALAAHAALELEPFSSGKQDVLVAKLNATGKFKWASSAGGKSNDYGWSVAVDSAGKPYFAGYFAGTATFGKKSLTALGGFDIFVWKPLVP